MAAVTEPGKRVPWVELYLDLIFVLAGSRPARLLRLAVLIATFQLGRLYDVLSPHGYVWLLAGWTLMCAFLTTRQSELTSVEALERHFRG